MQLNINRTEVSIVGCLSSKKQKCRRRLYNLPFIKYTTKGHVLRLSLYLIAVGSSFQAETLECVFAKRMKEFLSSRHSKHKSFLRRLNCSLYMCTCTLNGTQVVISLICWAIIHPFTIFSPINVHAPWPIKGPISWMLVKRLVIELVFDVQCVIH